MAPRTRSSARAGVQVLAPEESRDPSVPPTLSDCEETVSAEDSEPEIIIKRKTRKRTRKDYQESDTPVEPQAKRVRGKQGKLKGIMNMPIEVFTEISKYLYPLDLILLSRANKFFRQLLMNRSAIQTWRYALSNVPGLPPCPEQLCEPQYAALLFTKYCSMCGKQAPRPMDPMLLVRLCALCRDQESKPVDCDESGLVHTSTTLLPQKGGRHQWSCLRRDSIAYNNELDTIRRTGDQKTIRKWFDNRRREVNARKQNAQPLIKFINQMEAEQSDDLATRKGQRQDEIESRLLKLEWEEGDFEMREKPAMKKWKSLVCIAKPLTERDWEKILPQLTPLLERNRELRLEAETSTRQRDRESKTRRWLWDAFNQLEPYATLGEPQPKHGESTVSSGSTQSLPESAEDLRTLKAPHPALDQVIVLEPFQQLLTTDVPMEDFELALAAMRPALETAVLGWRANFEQSLIELLPPDDEATGEGSQSPTQGAGAVITSDSVLEPRILVNGRPMGDLSLGTRRLLRADTIFDRGDTSIKLYPESFAPQWSTPDLSVYRYNEELSKMSKALLASMGYANSTYLQMKALGPAFSCGRCVSRNCVTWREMLKHYVRERNKWDITRKHKLFKKGKNAYIFTHDTEIVHDDRPLMKMASEEDEKTAYQSSWAQRCCRICTPINNEKYETAAGVVDHVRNVHLIQDPKMNEHYTLY
ncbi:hypothetical protein FS749_002404 [Ceratobasidium sp. UAMH 11750]|nr:hypothetical protein FS749_002404 [Ceratobasidium sp. UAMH 11750]